MRKRRKARRHKAKNPLRSLRDTLGSWKSKWVAVKQEYAPQPRQNKRQTTQRHTTSPLIPTNLHAKWHELKQEKKSSDKPALAESRICSFLSKHRRFMLWGTCGLLIFTLLLGTLLYLRYTSKQKETDLIEAVRSADWVAVHQKLALANVFVYHFFNPHLQHSMGNAESWIQRQKDIYAQMHQKLADIESGKVPLESLSIHAVAEIERTLRALPASINDLSARWGMLHAQNRELLIKNRNFVMEQLLSHPDINSFLTYNEQEDIGILSAKVDEWDDFLETCRAYDIPPHLQAKGKTYLEDLRRYLAEAKALQALKENIQEAVTYNELTTQAKVITPSKYEPAVRIFGRIQSLPTREQWRKKMLPINRLIHEDKCDSAKTMLLRGGATYSNAFPVSQELYAQANELFASPSLHQRYYQVFHTDGTVHISEEFPQRKPNDRKNVFFALSAMDPAYAATASKTIAWEARDVKVRSISCAKMLQACKINREELFLKGNFPRLLETLICLKEEECPTLSKAFVFHRVLQLFKGHPFFSLHLQKFAPTLAADAASFAKLHDKHAGVMQCGAWLHPSQQVDEAEKDFAHWFKAHQHRDYYAEIAATAAPLFSATPRYVGLTDEGGTPRLRIPMKADTVIWYMSKDGIRATAPGRQPEDALPYSPLFINSNLR